MIECFHDGISHGLFKHGKDLQAGHAGSSVFGLLPVCFAGVKRTISVAVFQVIGKTVAVLIICNFIGQSGNVVGIERPIIDSDFIHKPWIISAITRVANGHGIRRRWRSRRH